MNVIIVVLKGFLLDAALGDPVYPLHPARLLGGAIAAGEKLLRRAGQSKAAAFAGGAALSLFLVAVSFGIYYFILSLLYKTHIVLGIAAEAVLCYQHFAAKALKDESMKVYNALAKGDLTKARLYLSYIVGRDTCNLDVENISKAAVETVAENLSDGVIAPMLCMFIGGAPLGIAYKAVNTLDSMIGYNNERYQYFGKCAARLDDIVNIIPARISALLMVFAAFLLGYDGKNAVRIFLRDRYNHKSPNSAQTESVCAGALGVALSGDSYYGGVLVKKPVIGDASRPVTPEDIKRANELMYTASWIGISIGVIIRIVIYIYV